MIGLLKQNVKTSIGPTSIKAKLQKSKDLLESFICRLYSATQYGPPLSASFYGLQKLVNVCSGTTRDVKLNYLKSLLKRQAYPLRDFLCRGALRRRAGSRKKKCQNEHLLLPSSSIA